MRYFFILLIFISGRCQSQNCAGIGRTPATAIPICGILVFNQEQLPACTGNSFQDALCGTNTYISDNSVWYKFNCYQTGTLGFVITPNFLTDDYDWSIFDITGNDPNAVFTNDLYAGINLSGLTGATGCIPGGIGSVNCAGSSPFNSMPTLLAGRTYLLMVTNYSNSGRGYSISFADGTADITDEVAPRLDSVKMLGCNNSEVTLFLSKDILCSSVTAIGTEFSIVGSGIPVVSAATSCIDNYSTKTIILKLQSPLPPGNYAVSINNGSDGNTLLDVCSNASTQAETVSFTVGAAPNPVFTSIEYSKCKPGSLKILYSKPLSCSSISADGSDFSITGPTSLNITGAQTDATCSNGYTNAVTLNFSTALDVTGNYTLSIQTGSDGNGIIDTCSNSQPINDQKLFDILESPSTAFTHTINWGCTEDTISLSHPGQPGIVSYEWSFNNSMTASGQNTTAFFNAETDTARIKFVIENANCKDSITRLIPLGNAFTASFTVPADTLCISNAIVFTNTSQGKDLVYEWSFGDNSTSDIRDPQPHFYIGSSNFDVRMIASNFTGCRDTADKTIHISNSPALNFSGLLASNCTGAGINLMATAAGYFGDFTWNTGESSIITTGTSVNFNFANEGNHIVSLTAQDRFCGTTTSRQMTNVIKTPDVDLGKDINICPAITKGIGIPAINGYSYVWNTGEATAAINVNGRSFAYRLTANNQGCFAFDDINVYYLNNCTIVFPSAFTPNNDGLNDIFIALNADLVKNLSWKIFDRYGRLVFYSNDILKGWDGRYKGQPAEMSTYVWVAEFIQPDTLRKITEKGSFTLIR